MLQGTPQSQSTTPTERSRSTRAAQYERPQGQSSALGWRQTKQVLGAASTTISGIRRAESER